MPRAEIFPVPSVMPSGGFGRVDWDALPLGAMPGSIETMPCECSSSQSYRKNDIKQGASGIAYRVLPYHVLVDGSWFGLPTRSRTTMGCVQQRTAAVQP